MRKASDVWNQFPSLVPARVPARARDHVTLCLSEFQVPHMATHSSILAWRIPGTEEPGKLQSVGSQRVGHS